MSYDDIHRISIEKGFFAPSCEIYSDAQAGFWEYGPLGVALRNRYIELWRRELVRRDGMMEIDGTQAMSKSVFVASDHLQSFADPIVICTKCGSITRADRMIAEKTGKSLPEMLPDNKYDQLIQENNLTCNACHSPYGKVSRFNMMFRLEIGPKGEEAYLRPETCQSIFVDYPRLFKTMRAKLPIGFAQFGKSFRNEIAPRQSLVRLREFYQAEIEVFLNPKNVNDFSKFDEVRDYEIPVTVDNGHHVRRRCIDLVEEGIIPNKFIAYYLAILMQFYEKTGIDTSRARFRKLGDDEKAFYALVAFDFEVETSIGWMELVACNYRSDYDLSRHSKVSGTDLTVQDDGEKVLPHIFELSMGVDRSIYTIMEHSLVTETKRRMLKFKPYLSPIQVAVFPLVNKDKLPSIAKEIYHSMKLDYDIFYDGSGSIGRRYRRQDEIGTPICITVDYDTPKDNSVTIRQRDSMAQERIRIDDLKDRIELFLSLR